MNNEEIISIVKTQSVRKRIRLDYDAYFTSLISYNDISGEYHKKIEPSELIIKINVLNDYEKTYQVGSFIRSVCALLTKNNPTKIMIIIDLLSYKNESYINIRKIIDQIVHTSTGLAILVNCYIVFPDFLFEDKQYLHQKNRCYIIKYINNKQDKIR